MRLAGVVEGLYGPTWDFLDRISVLELLGRLEMNVYVYAPKWDPYHKVRWRSPYPLYFEEELGRLTDAAKRFRWSLVSPGLGIDYSSERDLLLVLRKLEWGS